MFRIKIVIGIIKKEFIQVFRDLRMRFVLFAPPIIMLLVFGYAINTDVKNVRMILFDEDKTFESRQLIEKFTGSGYFFVIKYIEHPKEVDYYFDRGLVDIYLHIEKNFSKKLKNANSTSIQLILDGTDSSRSSMIFAAVNNLLQSKMTEYMKRQIRISIIKNGLRNIPSLIKPIEIKERIFYNTNLESRNFYMTGMFGLLISMITIILTAMSVVKERETGTIEELIVSPLKPIELVLGKTIPYMIAGFVDMIIISLLMIFWFKVPFRGSFFLLSISGIIFLMTTTATGLYISTISKTQQQALLSVILFLIPALLLSGFVFPIDAMPEIIKGLTYLNPMKYFIEIIRGIFLKGNGINILWYKILILFFIGGGLFYLSAKRFAEHLE
ncbi:MAG: ABC transporter permease [Brevinematales bacterium]|nr:ABC transporter permease [Brevinematales bacterium]